MEEMLNIGVASKILKMSSKKMHEKMRMRRYSDGTKFYCNKRKGNIKLENGNCGRCDEILKDYKYNGLLLTVMQIGGGGGFY